MTWHEIVASASDVIMDTFGASSTYHQHGSGGAAVEIDVDIDRDVEVVDETGSYSRQAMASFRSGKVTVATGDWIESDGEEWDVEMLNSDDGYITKVIVRPRP